MYSDGTALFFHIHLQDFLPKANIHLDLIDSAQGGPALFRGRIQLLKSRNLSVQCRKGHASSISAEFRPCCRCRNITVVFLGAKNRSRKTVMQLEITWA